MPDHSKNISFDRVKTATVIVGLIVAVVIFVLTV